MHIAGFVVFSERFIEWDEWDKTGIGWRDPTHIVLAKGSPKLLR
jgi:hypothetical protein